MIIVFDVITIMELYKIYEDYKGKHLGKEQQMMYTLEKHKL
jgi:hypothetical protein